MRGRKGRKEEEGKERREMSWEGEMLGLRERNNDGVVWKNS